MKNAILLHGMNDSPESFWLPYIKDNLEQKGYEVWSPQLPNNNGAPNLKEQLPFILNQAIFSAETLIIGHSCGCPLILSILENLNTKIKQAVLVSGFVTPLKAGEKNIPRTEGPNSILQDEYNWNKIKQNVKDLIFINSDNDPWGCDQKQAQIMFDHLGGTMIMLHDQGHMGSNKYNQPYKEFPFLTKLL